MALKMSFTVPAGYNVASLQSDTKITTLVKSTITEVSDGYVKIANQYGDKEMLSVDVEYKTNASANALFSEQYTLPLSTTDTAPNNIKQGYDYLKTLDEFKDAVDC